MLIFKYITPSLLGYQYTVPGNHAQATIFTPLCKSIARQSIVLKSCSNPQKMQRVFKSALK